MPSSGARSGTTPSRPRPAGSGRVGKRVLTCGHEARGNPQICRPGAGNRDRYWCPSCCGFKGLK